MKQAKHIKHHKNARFPCRELACERIAICRALCSKHYSQARHGWKLRLKYCTSEEPQLVPWLAVSAPVPDIVELSRPKWQFEPAAEQELIVEQERLDAEQKQVREV